MVEKEKYVSIRLSCLESGFVSLSGTSQAVRLDDNQSNFGKKQFDWLTLCLRVTSGVMSFNLGFEVAFSA